MNTYVWNGEQHTRSETSQEWDRLLSIPEDQDRQRTEVEELQFIDLTTALWPEPIDNTPRIRALFAEMDTCNDFGRVLEIEQELRSYGVEAVTEEDNRRLEDWLDGRELAQAGPL